MPAKTAEEKLKGASLLSEKFAIGDTVIAIRAGRDWISKVSSRRLPDGRQSIHP